ncbi:MAG: Calx-beta domain-containing protein, partial [Acidimicrobiales bacterium]
GFGVITNDDHATVVPGVASALEGDAGTTTVEVPVTLSNPSTQTVTVEWNTLFASGAPGDQADPATDYLPVSGTVTFAPGETTKTVTVVIDGDTVVEPDEYVVVSFHHPTNATMGGFWGLGFGVITNDD